MRWKTPLVALFAVAWTFTACMAPAFAQTPQTPQGEEEDGIVPEGCGDENGRNLCDQARWTKVVTSFGLEPAESIQSKGYRGVRVFTLNGYGNEMPAISILASRFDEYGDPEDAELDVRRQPFRGESNNAPASLKRMAWSNFYDGAEDLQDLVAASPELQPDKTKVTTPKPTTDGKDRDVVVICLHAWVTVTESLTDEGVARRVRDSCSDDPVYAVSYAMSGRALRGFPYCNHLDPANYRNESEQLERCFSLDGADRVAAAEVATIFDASIDVTADLAPYLAPDIRLNLPARATLSGPSVVIAALAEPVYKEFGVYAGHLTGASGRVTATGWFDRYVDHGYETADIVFTWRWRDNAWRIAEIVVGPSTIEE